MYAKVCLILYECVSLWLWLCVRICVRICVCVFGCVCVYVYECLSSLCAFVSVTLCSFIMLLAVFPMRVCPRVSLPFRSSPYAAGLLSFLLLWCLIAREEARVVAVAKKED